MFWVTRAKDNMQVRCVKKCLEKSRGPILRDDWVVLTAVKSKGKYPHFFCRIIAQVEVNGKLVEMTFITNNLEWSAGSICDLYKARWAIESFFKQIKQVLQICDFFGHSKNAIQWQVWMALLAYVLLRYLSFLSQWRHSFVRIFTVLRSVLWSRYQLYTLLKSYGTAGGSYRMLCAPRQAYLPGFG